MKTKIFTAVIVFLLMSCGSMTTPDSDQIIRQPEDAPANFALANGMNFEENVCKSPMVDPEDGTELIMVRSWGNGIGDYEVPEGKYGLAKREFLRVNCETGKLIGIVKK
ncbi:hypothetical protein LB465_15835 [Salegentibacter sp. LM13S]|uniref:hypothetical protein n=1 Tax=Salegentibacter lacus TaxID=2873599 RepID=UPI001CC9A74A|nr:hypothetical protein [Salegentibacter lacus]MBZ9632253.1 hypothetical protein [Salegentibacter lacus]